MHPAYPQWLARAVPTDATARTKLSELRRLELAYGDLDALYDEDELAGLLDELSYSVEDARLGRANPTRLEIGGELRTNLASYKSALSKYQRFRQDVETETARAVVTPEAARPEPEERLFSMERDLQLALRHRADQLEPGLTVIDGGAERQVPSGRIDILARDAQGRIVVIELKAVRAPRDAVAQLLAYMGDLQEEAGGEIRGILIAPDFDPRALAAARVVPGLRLMRYGFSFSFADA